MNRLRFKLPISPRWGPPPPPLLHRLLTRPATSSTVKANVTASEPTYGSALTQEGAASLPGYRFEPQSDERIYVAPAASVGIRILTTPTAMDTDIRLTFREIG